MVHLLRESTEWAKPVRERLDLRRTYRQRDCDFHRFGFRFGQYGTDEVNGLLVDRRADKPHDNFFSDLASGSCKFDLFDSFARFRWYSAV